MKLKAITIESKIHLKNQSKKRPYLILKTNNLMKHSLLIFSLFVVLSSAFSQTTDTRLNGLNEEINLWLQKYNAVGISVSVVEHNALVFSKGFGYRDLENKLPVTKNTVFPIASCSKAFTASLLGVLEGENKIALKNSPKDYIPKLKFYNSLMNEMITVEDLLSHKSGIGEVNGALVLFPRDNKMKILEKLQYLKPQGKVKESSLYSNMAYTVAGAIAEAVTGQTWETNIKNKLFKPLEMHNSFTNLEAMLQTNNYSLGYGLSKGRVEETLYEEYFSYKPAGGIRSSSKDLANWMMAWLNKGVFNNHQVLPENFILNAQRHHNDRNNRYEKDTYLQGYGLGWRVETTDGEFKVYHGGNTSGFSTVVVLFPFRNLGITVLSNQQNSVLPYIIADIIKNRMLEKPQVNPDDYPVQVTDIYKPEKRKEELNTKKPPTHQLKSFEGIYHNKGYGTIEIQFKNNSLYAKFPTYTFILEHTHYNVFTMQKMEKISHFNPEFFPLNFKLNNKGEIDAFTIDYFQTEPVVFLKE